MNVSQAPARSRKFTFSAHCHLSMPAAVAGAIFAITVAAHAQTPELRLQLLNGRTGRPVTAAHVTLWRDMNHSRLDKNVAPVSTTDGEGYVAIPSNDSEFLVLEFERRQPCSKTFQRTFSLTDVRTHGLVSENSCSPHIHMFAEQGTLIVFVRDQTWLERLRH